jgi:acyl-CoA thioester hydrolase
MEVQGLQLPVIEAHCDYKLPVRYDDLIEISGWVEECRGARLKVRCEIHRDGELLASGHTIHVCVTIATRKPRRLPPELADQLMAGVRGTVH